ncbi:hypothetical protein FACS1894105_08120 [Clostridia bacterium]|nr:hypothetical protein FACS1894105_08120 [Clostridia bacterium]
MNFTIGLPYGEWRESDDYATKWSRFKNFCSIEYRLPKKDAIGIESKVSAWYYDNLEKAKQRYEKNASRSNLTPIEQVSSLIEEGRRKGDFKILRDFLIKY